MFILSFNTLVRLNMIKIYYQYIVFCLCFVIFLVTIINFKINSKIKNIYLFKLKNKLNVYIKLSFIHRKNNF